MVAAPKGAVIWRLCVNWPVLVTTNVTVPHGIVVSEKLNLGGTIASQGSAVTASRTAGEGLIAWVFPGSTLVRAERN
jgi:hypothetical protein